MGKGILMEVAGRKAVVLTPQGEFKSVPLPRGRWDLGDEIDFAEQRQAPWMRWGVAAAAVLMMLLSPVGYQSWANAQPWALVTVDINPSLELTLNRKSEVLEARGLNTDGEQVLQGVQWKRKPVEEVVAAVTDRAIEEQKLNVTDDASLVLVAVAPVKNEALPVEQAQSIREKTRVAAEQEIEAEAQVRQVEPKTHVASLAARPEERQQARENDISVGRWVMVQTAQSMNVQIGVEELKAQGPGKALNELGLNLGEILGEAEAHHGGKSEKRQKPAKNEQSGPDDKTKGPDKDKSKDENEKDDKPRGQSDQDDDQSVPVVDDVLDVLTGSDDRGSQENDKRQDENGGQSGEKEKDRPVSGQRDEKQDEQRNNKSRGSDKPKGDSPGRSDKNGNEPDKQQRGKDSGKETGKDSGKDSGKGKSTGASQGDSIGNRWSLPFLDEILKHLPFGRSTDNVSDSDADLPRAETPGAGAPDTVDNPSEDDQKGQTPGRDGKGESDNGGKAEQEKEKREKAEQEKQEKAEQEKQEKQEKAQQEKQSEDEQEKPEKQSKDEQEKQGEDEQEKEKQGKDREKEKDQEDATGKNDARGREEAEKRVRAADTRNGVPERFVPKVNFSQERDHS